MASRKLYVDMANDLGDALARLRDLAELDKFESARHYATLRDTGFGRALEAVCRSLKADNSKFSQDRFLAAIEWRAATGKLVKVGQTNFDIPVDKASTAC